MADIIPVAKNFDQGFRSDTSRDELSPAAAFRMRDWIPQLEAPVRKRGGWSYGSPDMNTLGGTITAANAIGWLPFAGDGHLVVVSGTGSVYQLKRFDGAGGALVSNTGTTNLAPTQNVFWHKTGTTAYGIIVGGLQQVNLAPNKYFDTGGGVYQTQLLGGSPPAARMGFSWGDYLVLGNYYDPSAGGALKNFRWAFSAVGNPDSWTLSGASAGTLDFPEEMIAGIPIRNAIIAFGYESCYVITGDTPPPGGNLARRPLFGGNGTIDPKSVVSWRDQAIWASSSGVYQSDGTTLIDLTYEGGISNYYRQKVAGFHLLSGYTAAAGIYRDHYVLSILGASGDVIATLACDLERKVWTEWSNVNGACFAHLPASPGTTFFSGDEELFFGHSLLPRVGKISDLWKPAVGNATDADGTAVLPVLETPFYKLGTDSLKRLRRMFIGYDIRTAGANPALSVAYVRSPEVGLAYTPLSDVYPTTTAYRRKQGRVGVMGLGVGLRLTQTAASADTRIYDIGIEAHPMDATRAGGG